MKINQKLFRNQIEKNQKKNKIEKIADKKENQDTKTSTTLN